MLLRLAEAVQVAELQNNFVLRQVRALKFISRESFFPSRHTSVCSKSDHPRGKDSEVAHVLPCDSASMSFALTVVLTGLANLHHLTVQGPHTLTTMMMTSCSSRNLRYLKITLTSADAIFSLRYLGNFGVLQCLELDVKQCYGTYAQRLTTFHPEPLKNLRELRIICDGIDSIGIWSVLFNRFLAKCHFPALETLHYDFGSRRGMGAEAVDDLAVALENMIALRHASLKLPIEPELWERLLPHMKASSVELHPISDINIELLPPPTTDLHMRIASSKQELENIFEALLKKKNRIKTVHLGDMDWLAERQIRSIYSSYAVCTKEPPYRSPDEFPSLLKFTSKLVKKGITVRDAFGKTLLDHLQS